MTADCQWFTSSSFHWFQIANSNRFLVGNKFSFSLLFFTRTNLRVINCFSCNFISFSFHYAYRFYPVGSACIIHDSTYYFVETLFQEKKIKGTKSWESYITACDSSSFMYREINLVNSNSCCFPQNSTHVLSHRASCHVGNKHDANTHVYSMHSFSIYSAPNIFTFFYKKESNKFLRLPHRSA